MDSEGIPVVTEKFEAIRGKSNRESQRLPFMFKAWNRRNGARPK
jgi:hypothetical protein